MDRPLFQASGELLTGSKSLRFPVRLVIRRADFQSALADAWQALHRIGAQAAGWQSGHGRLMLLPVQPESAEGLDCEFFREDAAVRLEVSATLELVFGFQAALWERLEAVAGVMDFLVRLTTASCTEKLEVQV